MIIQSNHRFLRRSLLGVDFSGFYSIVILLSFKNSFSCQLVPYLLTGYKRGSTTL